MNMTKIAKPLTGKERAKDFIEKLPSSVDAVLNSEEINKVFHSIASGDKSLTEISKRLNKKLPTIKYHIDKLEEVGLIIKEKTSVREIPYSVNWWTLALIYLFNLRKISSQIAKIIDELNPSFINDFKDALEIYYLKQFSEENKKISSKLEDKTLWSDLNEFTNFFNKYHKHILKNIALSEPFTVDLKEEEIIKPPNNVYEELFFRISTLFYKFSEIIIPPKNYFEEWILEQAKEKEKSFTINAILENTSPDLILEKNGKLIIIEIKKLKNIDEELNENLKMAENELAFLKKTLQEYNINLLKLENQFKMISDDRNRLIKEIKVIKYQENVLIDKIKYLAKQREHILFKLSKFEEEAHNYLSRGGMKM